MNTRLILITILLPVISGCESYTRPLGVTNTTVASAKQGEDCRLIVFGLGDMADVTEAEAIRSGGITKLRNAEYHVHTFQGVGKECVTAHGE
ncbi:hypothetical protein W02_26570 [Nitrospira sp. KM1]|uniref:hypothetical protein n=1 Tax=Nitrospira sp. KM1 TaxID=1936990 RepID=UPI0013A79F16|nr:hypothetical protein [Nitrospira sp. KM1]BCA55517.1 hypothetical protein W02_26570 [Nitrospira sp. KM1]